jgi:uncharacterized protein involved in exopolysaccharide biosynthesis
LTDDPVTVGFTVFCLNFDTLHDVRMTKETQSPPAGNPADDTRLVAHGAADTLHFRPMLALVARRWRLVLTVELISIGLAVLFLHIVTYKYTITMEVSPADSGNTAQRSSIGGAFAALTGSLTPDTNRIELYMAALTSIRVATAISNKPEIMHRLFDKEWDPATQSWQPTRGPLLALASGLKRLLGFPPPKAWAPPDAKSVLDLLKKQIVIEYQPNRPLVTITYRHKDPRFGVEFIEAIHEAADAQLRQAVLYRTTAYVDYLLKELQSVSVVAYRDALAQVLAQQELQRIQTQADVPYAIEIFGPPTASPRPTTPQAPVVLVAAALAGLMISILLVFTISVRPAAGTIRETPAVRI